MLFRSIADAFVARVVDLSRQVAFGNPLNPDTQVGAIVTPEHAAKIDAHVRAAVAAGSTVCLGGAPLIVPGLGPQFYQPTVIRNVTPDMAIARDEVFGPVLVVLTFRTLDQAIALTNDATYGLSAGIWCDDVHNLPGVQPPRPGGHGLDQHLDGRLSRGGLWRGQAIRPGPRDRRRPL